MIKNYFLIIFRSFFRFKNTFLINLIGLSIGLACVILIYLWVNDELNFDKFYKNDARLYKAIVKAADANPIENLWNKYTLCSNG
ncbi:MAG TPA: ABC transporter permease [Ignavibacteriaceae bacterium]|nr:ABC transporter permease [Ignavibacteriaceae bacterium]